MSNTGSYHSTPQQQMESAENVAQMLPSPPQHPRRQILEEDSSPFSSHVKNQESDAVSFSGGSPLHFFLISKKLQRLIFWSPCNEEETRNFPLSNSKSTSRNALGSQHHMDESIEALIQYQEKLHHHRQQEGLAASQEQNQHRGNKLKDQIMDIPQVAVPKQVPLFSGNLLRKGQHQDKNEHQSPMIDTSALMSLLLTINILSRESFVMHLQLRSNASLQEEFKKDSGASLGDDLILSKLSESIIQTRNQTMKHPSTETIHVLVHDYKGMLYALVGPKIEPSYRILLRQVMARQHVRPIRNAISSHSATRAFRCSDVAKYLLVDCFPIQKNDHHIFHHGDTWNSRANAMLHSTAGAFHDAGSTPLPPDKMWYMFDCLESCTLHRGFTSNYVLHPSSEHYSSLLACCRYNIQNCTAQRFVIQVMQDVYVGIIRLPLYTSSEREQVTKLLSDPRESSEISHHISQSFLIILMKEKPPHCNESQFEEVRVPMSNLCDLHGAPLEHTSPFLQMKWCTDAQVFSTEQQQCIDSFASQFAEISPSHQQQTPKKPPRRRFVASPSPLSYLNSREKKSLKPDTVSSSGVEDNSPSPYRRKGFDLNKIAKPTESKKANTHAVPLPPTQPPASSSSGRQPRNNFRRFKVS